MRIAFLGLGIMGSRMAANLVTAGHELTVYNRTRETAERWAGERGARVGVAGTPGEAAAAAELVVTMVVDGPQVRALLLGDGGVAAAAAPGTLCVDMSTIAPSETQAIGAALSTKGVGFMDAPVTGSSPRAEAGTLTIMAGGEAADFERARGLLETMGQLVLYVGELGQGQTVKLINNAVSAANASTLAQALIVGRATGVDLDALVAIMGAGSGGSMMLELKAGPMRDHDYTTLFKLEHMLKDVRLCLESSQAAGVPFPAAAAVGEILTAGMGRDLGNADFAALVEVFEAMADVRL